MAHLASFLRVVAGRRPRLIAPALAVVACICSIGVGETELRIATYNIKFLDAAKLPNEGDRADKLRQIISDLSADVIALQEIDDRDALEQIFDPTDWWLIIDDESGDEQDVALAVRRTFQVQGFSPGDEDADAEDFLFPDSGDNDAFPNKRDVLHCEVVLPAEEMSLHVLVIHAKARFGGRATTDPRREDAARLLLETLEQEFDDRLYVVLGDFNDSPDDRSLNILETGNPQTPAGPEEIDGPFLINLTETLWAEDMVSHGRKSNELTPDGQRVNLIDPGSRERNNNARGTDVNTGDILFDQILMPATMLPFYSAESIAIFDQAIAAEGNNTNRASDHLPVFADFVFSGSGSTDGGTSTPSTGVHIVSLLPNPSGQDAGNERVTLRNTGPSAVNLVGWSLRDRAQHTFAITTGTMAAGADLVIVMTTNDMPLTNTGDDVLLVAASGDVVDSASYTASQVKEGEEIHFGP